MKMASVFVMLLVVDCPVGRTDDDAKVSELIERFGRFEYSHQFREGYRSLFAACDGDQLSELLDHSDDSIAIQTAWETVTFSVPPKEGTEVYRPDKQKLYWFLGFLEGRTRVRPPDWWREVVVDARANRRDNIYPGEPSSVPYHATGNGSVHCPKDASVRQDGGSVVYSQGKNSITIPEDLLDRDDSGELWEDISGCFTDKKGFLAIHTDVGYPHELACIERPSGKLLWKSEVCGCWWGGATGFHQSFVTVMATNDERVFVFGSSSIGIYAHGFRATDGKSFVRFSTNY